MATTAITRTRTTSDPITDDNIFRELNNSGISWKVYAQSYSLAGGTVTTPDNHNGTSYYRRHNGATWYSDILSNVNKSASNIVDLTQLTNDVADGKTPCFCHHRSRRKSRRTRLPGRNVQLH